MGSQKVHVILMTPRSPVASAFKLMLSPAPLFDISHKCSLPPQLDRRPSEGRKSGHHVDKYLGPCCTPPQVVTHVFDMGVSLDALENKISWQLEMNDPCFGIDLRAQHPWSTG